MMAGAYLYKRLVQIGALEIDVLELQLMLEPRRHCDGGERKRAVKQIQSAKDANRFHILISNAIGDLINQTSLTSGR